MTDKQPPQTNRSAKALSGRQIAQAAGMLLIGTILSRVAGLAREAILSSLFGGGATYEAFIAAIRPADTLFFVVAGGAIGSAFIPTFAEALQKEDHRDAWEMASAVLTLIASLIAILAALMAIFARPITLTLLVPGFADQPEKLSLTVTMMQIMLISPVIFSLSGLFMGILNTHQRFLLPALAPMFYNIGIILGGLLLVPMMGPYGLAWGVVLGAALHMLIQAPGLLALDSSIKPRFDIKHSGVREVARLMGPRVLGLAIVQVNFWVNANLASRMVDGSLAAIQRAWYLLLLPQGLIAQSVANAVFPTFSIQVSQKNHVALRQTLGQVLSAVLFISIPAMIGLVILRLPIVQLIYEHGAFTSADAHATSWALLFYGLGLVSHSLVEIITRAFYAMHDTRTPVFIGGGAMLLNVVFSLLFIQLIGEPGSLMRGSFAGLALANTLATTLEGLLLLVLIGPRVGGLDVPTLALGTGKAALAGLGMGAALWFLLPWLTGLGQLLAAPVGISIGGVVFFVLAWAFRSEEMQLAIGIVRRRLNR